MFRASCRNQQAAAPACVHLSYSVTVNTTALAAMHATDQYVLTKHILGLYFVQEADITTMYQVNAVG